MSCLPHHSNLYEYNVMVYISGENDLSEFASNSISRMSNAFTGKSSDININVFCDGRYLKHSNGAPVEANIFRLTNNGMRLVENLGSVNSGDKEVAKKFIDASIKPSAKNILIFWGHSSGIDYLESDDPAFKAGLLIDNSAANSAMSIEDLVEVIEYAHNKIGKKIDLIGLDVCSLMHAEIAFDIRYHARYFAGSQDKQNGLSWDYEAIVKWLNNNSFDPIEGLIDWITTSFSYFYDYGIHEIFLVGKKERNNDTFSIIDLSKVSNLQDRFISLITKLNNEIKLNNNTNLKNNILVEAISPSVISNSCSNILDIYTFIEKMIPIVQDNSNISSSNKSSILLDIEDILKDKNKVVVNSYSRGRSLNAKGLSVRSFKQKLEGKKLKTYNFDKSSNNTNNENDTDNSVWYGFLRDLFSN